MASALFGFTYCSAGFPVLIAAQGEGHRAQGRRAFLPLKAMCAATGYVLGQRVGKGIADRFRALGGLEYLFAVVGAALLAAGAAAHLEVAVLLVGVGALGAVSVARRAQRAR